MGVVDLSTFPGKMPVGVCEGVADSFCLSVSLDGSMMEDEDNNEASGEQYRCCLPPLSRHPTSELLGAGGVATHDPASPHPGC